MTSLQLARALAGQQIPLLVAGETQMPVTDADEIRVVELLSRDVATTLGPGHEESIRETPARVRTFRDEPADYLEKVVEDVQQDFHDLFIDTTWPACPFHSHHPLWLHNGHWTCEQDSILVAPLGQLRSASGHSRT